MVSAQFFLLHDDSDKKSHNQFLVNKKMIDYHFGQRLRVICALKYPLPLLHFRAYSNWTVLSYQALVRVKLINTCIRFMYLEWF